MSKRWYSTEFLQAAPSGDVSKEKGVIEGVSVCTVGEAKGHGVNLDSEFIETIARFGNGKKQGLKARFGHPNMCSTALGTFVGRFKNFRVIGEQAKADLFLSNEAKETPHGNLHDYIIGMAENEPDMFGTSIVFTPGRIYRRDGSEKVFAPGSSVDKGERGADWQEWKQIDSPDFVECKALHACDAVDEPAANDGLFSRFSQETIAGQITEFLDLNPHVWRAVESNPSIVEALARYADRVDEFIERYRTYREQNKEADMPEDTTSAETLEEQVDNPQPEAAEESEVKDEDSTPESAEEKPEEQNEEVAETEESESGEENDEQAGSEEPVEELAEEEPAELSRDEFCKIVDKFGAEIAAQVVRDGGDYGRAVELAYESTKAELAEAKEKLAAKGGTPVKVVEAKPEKKASLFNTGK